MGRYFGTDGFRGEAGATLTAEHAYKVGRFLGWYYAVRKERSRAKILIGKDTRISGYMLEYALVSGITASGSDAYIMHVTTTPSVAHITRVEGFDCGIMISASHNAYYDNGLKLFGADGEKVGDYITSLIEDYIDGLPVCGVEALPYAVRYGMGKSVDFVEGRNRYIAYLISLGVCSFRGLKVGLDCANGSAWNLSRAVFEALGADTYVINANPNGLNINENSGSTHPEQLCRAVLQNKLNVGFAFDGDADRCICVDECGNVVSGDKILYACGSYLKGKGELSGNTIVTTVMSNMGLFRALDELDIKYVKTAVGDRFVHEYMRTHGNALGGEQSGHIIFSKHSTTGDGILTAIKVLEIICERGISLSKLCSPVTEYPQLLLNIKVYDKEVALADEDVRSAVNYAKSLLADRGRIIVRCSGTEPLIRIMVEADEYALCNSAAQEVAGVLKLKGYAL